ncbi:uncharacterized protein B4U79_10402 [Dinothrombium tinctorium]|uniref:PEHE domain-containing protein n=1 Tax=Dinothrombium tinctorium TaxID=1965070 RepID=A0A443R1R8_9ACAR|nr:uncharacterized protein B4U79_10402 [Dinothrombium tinctorium]
MNSFLNGTNENAVNVSTNGALLTGAQLTTPTRMGLLNNSSVKDGITHKVLLLKPSKVENGQRLNLVTLALTPSINASVNPSPNPKLDALNNSRRNANTMSTMNTQLPALDDTCNKTNLHSNLDEKKQLKSSEKREMAKLKQESKTKCSSNKEGNYCSQQLSLEAHTQSLIKRIKRLQAKQLQKHVEKQLKGFVRCEQTVNEIGCQYLNDQKKDECSSCTSHAKKQVSSAEDKIKLFSAEGVKSLSTSALQQTMPSVIQSPSTTCNDSSLAKLLQQRSENVSESNGTSVHTNKLVVKREEIEELSAACGTLKSNLQHLEGSYDSDATESSSGGESGDELDELNSFKQTQLTGSNASIPIDKRASWKWYVERGAIASRWTWLQAQVADLEFKIRQQNEMYRQLRANKGTITFSYRENMPTAAGVSPQDLNKQNASNEVTERTSPSTVNEDEMLHCVRTLPLKQMRKRKLVRAASALSGATRKIARHSTVQCICNSLPHYVSPCVLCNGRYGYVQVIDTDCMPHYERIALLDSSCHSVLSLPNDVSLGLHFSKLLKKETIQQPATARHQYKKRKGSQPSDFAYKFGVDGRKGRKSQAVISSSKLRKKYDGTVKRKYSKNSCGDQGFSKRPKFRDGHEHPNGSGDSRHDPSFSPFCADSGTSAPLNRRRRSEQQFDINNIVIPYSIASATRVEKLQYKEILTPKWRVTESEDGVINNTVIENPDDIEDLSDEAFAERHQRCEADERKRFGCALNKSRSRLSRQRLDSSRSEFNTNYVNNATGDSNIDSSSQDSFASNPVSSNTGLTANSHDHRTNQEVTHGTPAKTTERHRTSSSSKRDDSIDEDSYIEVPPYEKRRFPLSDVAYTELLEVKLHDDSESDSVVIQVKQETKSTSNAESNTTNERPETPHSTSSSSLVDNGAETDDNAADPEWEPKE